MRAHGIEVTRANYLEMLGGEGLEHDAEFEAMLPEEIQNAVDRSSRRRPHQESEHAREAKEVGIRMPLDGADTQPLGNTEGLNEPRQNRENLVRSRWTGVLSADWLRLRERLLVVAACNTQAFAPFETSVLTGDLWIIDPGT